MILRGIAKAVLLTAIASTAQLVVQEEQPLQIPTACGLLAATFPDSVTTRHNKKYTESTLQYWSGQQADLKPDCRFYPKGSREIQEALADIILPFNASIAVTSGGRSSNTGASNVDQGITIDLARFNSTSLVDGNEAVVLGVGARWGDVFETLERHNLTVPGSRVSDDAVGGHILGGGLAWFANEHGWTCDSVLEAQIITPQGQILWTNLHWNDDLFWAQKGTLGALGIVTHVKLPTIKTRKMYGGITSHTSEHAALLFEALHFSNVNSAKDPAQLGYISFRWIEKEKEWSYHAYLLNTEHQKRNEALDKFMQIPTMGSSLRTVSIGDSATEIAKTRLPGLRRSKFTLTAKSFTNTMEVVHNLIRSYTAKLKFASDSQSQLLTTYEPLTLPHLQASPPQSNTFDLSYADGALLIISVELSWQDNSRDEYFESSARNLRKAIQQELSNQKALHNFIYPPYAARDQNIFAGLSKATRSMLKEVRKKFDPDEIWKKHVPGIRHI